jgi:hypothetical protein
VDAEAAVLIGPDEIGEGAAGVDADRIEHGLKTEFFPKNSVSK